MIFCCETLCSPSSSLVVRGRRFRVTDVGIYGSPPYMALSCVWSKWTLSFKLNGNITAVDDRRVRDGKFAISLTELAWDVAFPKVNPNLARQLCHFLRAMQNREKADTSDDGTLVIASRRDYPQKEPFPPHLESLHTRNMGLRSFDNRILQLADLSVLNVGNNWIPSVPKALECLRLTHLSLKSNRLVAWPSVSRDSALAGSLRCLDLSENRIAWLPEDFWNLGKLQSLLITDNRLGALPAANLHRVTKLKNIELRNNRLRCLPYAASQFLEVGKMSLTGNRWMAPFFPKKCGKGPKSLFHFASASFLRDYEHILSDLESQLPRDVQLRLQVLRRCHGCCRLCGVEEDRYVGCFTLRHFKRMYAIQQIKENFPVFICYCCSSHCAARVRKPKRFFLVVFMQDVVEVSPTRAFAFLYYVFLGLC